MKSSPPGPLRLIGAIPWWSSQMASRRPSTTGESSTDLKGYHGLFVTTGICHPASWFQRAAPDIRRVFAMVKIVDEAGRVVSDATVDGEWTLPGDRLRAQQQTTNAAGVARFMWKVVPFGTYQLCVLDVTKSGLAYDPSQNVETCDSITVPISSSKAQ